MELVPRSKITKGKLAGMDFLYNPSAFQDSQSVTYNELKTAGISYPIPTYGGGNQRNVTFDIYLNDRVQSGITKVFINKLSSHLPKARKKGYQFQPPEPLIFAFGWYVKECLLADMQIEYTAFSPELRPIEAKVTVTLAVIQ